MDITSLTSELQNFSERCPEKSGAAHAIIDWIEKYQSFAFYRENLEWHLTASLLVVNPERTRVLLMFHKKLQLWLQFWGHCDGESDTFWVAIREFHEESGVLEDPEVFDFIFDADVHHIPVDAKWTPPHLHLDILYLAEVPETVEYAREESEVDDIRWFDIDGIEKYIGEKRMLDMIARILTLT